MKKQGTASKPFQAASTGDQDCPRLHRLHARLGIHLTRKNEQLKETGDERRYAIPVEKDKLSVFFANQQMLEITPRPVSGFRMQISGFTTAPGVQKIFLYPRSAEEAFFMSTLHMAGEMPDDAAKKIEPLMLAPAK